MIKSNSQSTFINFIFISRIYTNAELHRNISEGSNSTAVSQNQSSNSKDAPLKDHSKPDVSSPVCNFTIHYDILAIEVSCKRSGCQPIWNKYQQLRLGFSNKKEKADVASDHIQLPL